jgi:hypothetical protein
MKRLAVLILLASCARQSPTALPVAVPSPPGPERCQEGVPVPPSPRAPRTVEQLGDWAIRAERAARQTEPRVIEGTLGPRVLRLSRGTLGPNCPVAELFDSAGRSG